MIRLVVELDRVAKGCGVQVGAIAYAVSRSA